MMRTARSTILITLLLAAIVTTGRGTETTAYINPDLVNKLYERQPAWLNDAPLLATLQQQFLNILDSAASRGLKKEKYHYAAMLQGSQAEQEKTFADALISYAKDVYCGADISQWIIHDEISAKYAGADEKTLLNIAAAIKSSESMTSLLSTLEPDDQAYTLLKSALIARTDSPLHKTTAALGVCLNLYRWIHHFHLLQYIVVNIPSATLRYYHNGSAQLEMKVVVGKPTTRTPRFAAYCNEVILYPYWHVPLSIASKELLPKFRRNPSAIDKENMQVITKTGKVVNHHGIDWGKYSGANFPYIFRQYTGCDNALGVIKFNLTDPFDVYMHDTNFKGAFGKKTRFLSHGCIRLEKPVELGNYLLGDKLNPEFLTACIEGQKPVSNKLANPVPVFVVYMPATVDSSNKVIFLNDVYHLFK